MIFEILKIVMKSLVAAFVLFILARLMGKKQISQLTFFDYVVGISIGSIAAAMSVDKRISIRDGITSMIVWAILPILFSYISIHSIFARKLFDGTPEILIKDGKIIEINMKKSKFTVNDLLEELRLKDIFDISEVDYAILETNGKLSVLKKNLSQDRGMCINVIIDGKFMKDNMKELNIDAIWLQNELKKANINSVYDVLLANCDKNHKLYIDSRNPV